MSDLPDAALILAGGLGTRLRPRTNLIPKPLVRIGGKPIIAHIIDEISRNGIGTIYVSVGYKAEMIEKYLKSYRSNAKIKIVREKAPLGTGGAVRFAISRIGTGFNDLFVTNGDDLFTTDIKRMYLFHKSRRCDITICTKKARNNKELSSSGVLKLAHGRVVGFVEKPAPSKAPSKFINIGKYIFSSRVAGILPKQRKFSLERDFLERTTSKLKICAYECKGAWYPVDTFERLRIARSKWH
mgnify:CR=1 FL=1